MSTMLLRDRSNLARDVDNLLRWEHHFSKVGNNDNESGIRELTLLLALSFLDLCHELTDYMCVREDLSDNISGEKITGAISQMLQGRNPDLNEISTEILK